MGKLDIIRLAFKFRSFSKQWKEARMKGYSPKIGMWKALRAGALVLIVPVSQAILPIISSEEFWMSTLSATEAPTELIATIVGIGTIVAKFGLNYWKNKNK